MKSVAIFLGLATATLAVDTRCDDPTTYLEGIGCVNLCGTIRGLTCESPRECVFDETSTSSCNPNDQTMPGSDCGGVCLEMPEGGTCSGDTDTTIDNPFRDCTATSAGQYCPQICVSGSRRCDENERFESCGSSCPRKCGDDPDAGCIALCQQNVCRCQDNYVLDVEDGVCILEEYCPMESTDSPMTTDMKSTQESFPVCRTIQGLQCEAGLVCVDDPDDSCTPNDPTSPGSDCAGICIEPLCCDPAELEELENSFKCREGCECCPDGSIGFGIGGANIFSCEMGFLIDTDKNEQGEFCELPSSTANLIETTDMESTTTSTTTTTTTTSEAPLTSDIISTQSTEVDVTDVCCEYPEATSTNNPCWEGCVCCADGTVGYSIGSATQFTCNGNLVTIGVDEFGEFCDTGLSTTEFPDFDFCGGIASIPCQEGYICIDDPRDNCNPYDPKSPGADCGGICIPAPTSTEEMGATESTQEAACCERPDTSSLPNACWEGCECCPDGSIAYSNGGGGYYCNGQLAREFGEWCDEPSSTEDREDPESTESTEEPETGCCDRDEFDTMVDTFKCREGCACCPDGTIVVSIGDASTFECNGVELVKDEDEFGEFCATEEPTTSEEDDGSTEEPLSSTPSPTYQLCGGIASIECDEGYICIDDPSDDCDPDDKTSTDADCSGICIEETTTTTTTTEEPCVGFGCHSDANKYGLIMAFAVIASVFGWM